MDPDDPQARPPEPAHPGRFVVFEGGEGAGKSTQAARLAARLGAVLTHEPGGTAVGTAIRALLLDPATAGLDDRAEALLMAADRAQHVAQVVRPALAAGRHVVSDRYIGSSLAYQGYGRGLPVDDLRGLSVWAAGGLWPDAVVLLDIGAGDAAGRMDHRPDRMEAAGEDFHRRVGEGYRALAAADPEHWLVVDGSPEPDAVESAVWKALVDRLPDLAGVPNASGVADVSDLADLAGPGDARRAGLADAPGARRDESR
jgi:dTMP kinase